MIDVGEVLRLWSGTVWSTASLRASLLSDAAGDLAQLRVGERVVVVGTAARR